MLKVYALAGDGQGNGGAIDKCGGQLGMRLRLVAGVAAILSGSIRRRVSSRLINTCFSAPAICRAMDASRILVKTKWPAENSAETVSDLGPIGSDWP